MTDGATPMTRPEPGNSFEDSAVPAARYGWMLAIMAGTVGVCLAIRSYLTPIDIAMLLLLGVVLVASRLGLGASVAASVLGIAAFDFFFVPPYYTFAVADSSFFFTFGVMLLVALSMTRLTSTIRQQAIEARQGEARTVALFALSRELAEAESREAIVAIAARHAGLAGGGTATIVLADEVGLEDGVPVWPAAGMFEDTASRVAAGWAYLNGEAAGAGTRHGAVGDVLVVPLRGSRTLGVLAVRPDPADRRPTESECRTIQALADQAALALELGTLAQRWEQQAREGS
jgi:two-component system sensor histidine kinase KdpD